MTDIRVSVALATYNGEKYIEEQLRTVLANLSECDEVIISDDSSSDRTREIIQNFNDPRIRLIDGPREGIKQNFGNAIKNCSGRYIFLCDQDDIWAENKVERVLAVFEEKKPLVVVHDCELFNDSGAILLESFFDYSKSRPGLIKNILKNSYIGCCMAFDSVIKEKILPIPNSIEMHDQWIGVLGDKYGHNEFIKECLIRYRRHEGNASDCFHHYSFARMLRNRVCFVFNLEKRIIRNAFSSLQKPSDV